MCGGPDKGHSVVTPFGYLTKGTANYQSIKSIHGKNPTTPELKRQFKLAEQWAERNFVAAQIKRKSDIKLKKSHNDTVAYLDQRLGPGITDKIMKSIGYKGNHEDFERDVIVPLINLNMIDVTMIGDTPMYHAAEASVE